MAILKVARMGHPVLRAKALPIRPKSIGSPALQQLIDDMLETMQEYEGIGLAAPQIHEGLRLFVAGAREAPIGDEVGPDGEMPVLTLINPELTLVGEATHDGWEGCLSVPDIRGRVPRSPEIQVRAFGRDGRRLEFTARGLAARVIQHETDHLDGILFLDRMRSFESLTYMDEYRRHWTKPDDDDGEGEGEGDDVHDR
ncbi:MAG TPA: peptide deformylase [Vicinamibacterales bacterium]|nr:peptide deformylase [Vicinamibacterales bacterium]